MKLNYNVTDTLIKRNKKSVYAGTLTKFLESGNPVAEVELDGTNIHTAYKGLIYIRNRKKIDVDVIQRGGRIFLLRRAI